MCAHVSVCLFSGARAGRVPLSVQVHVRTHVCVWMNVCTYVFGCAYAHVCAWCGPEWGRRRQVDSSRGGARLVVAQGGGGGTHAGHGGLRARSLHSPHSPVPAGLAPKEAQCGRGTARQRRQRRPECPGPGGSALGLLGPQCRHLVNGGSGGSCPVSLTAPARVPKPQHRLESCQALLALQANSPQPLPLPAPRPPGHSPNIWLAFPASWGAGAGSQEGPVCGTVWECHHWDCENQRVRGRSLAWLVGGGGIRNGRPPGQSLAGA